MKRLLCFSLTVVLFILTALLQPVYALEGGKDIMDFRTVLRNRIMEILESWPAEDQYAIMFFIYPNECYEYGGYSNIPEFIMLYKRESDMSPESQPDPSASSRNEEKWNPVFWWDCGGEETVISFDEPNPMADKLIEWYESTGVQNIGYEDSEQCYDSHMKYIDKGPNGLPELLQLAVDIAKELQTNGFLESKFGKKIPIILADYEFTWYMIKATCEANPHGEADEYINACLSQGWIDEDLVR